MDESTQEHINDVIKFLIVDHKDDVIVYRHLETLNLVWFIDTVVYHLYAPIDHYVTDDLVWDTYSDDDIPLLLEIMKPIPEEDLSDSIPDNYDVIFRQELEREIVLDFPETPLDPEFYARLLDAWVTITHQVSDLIPIPDKGDDHCTEEIRELHEFVEYYSEKVFNKLKEKYNSIEARHEQWKKQNSDEL